MDLPSPANDPHAEIRDGVRKLCARFPGEYWRKLDQERGYPTAFVSALPPCIGTVTSTHRRFPEKSYSTTT